MITLVLSSLANLVTVLTGALKLFERWPHRQPRRRRPSRKVVGTVSSRPCVERIPHITEVALRGQYHGNFFPPDFRP